MQFTGKEDIEKPIDEVFDAVTDYEAFEKQVMRRGHEITRLDAQSSGGVGMSWKMRIPVRGTLRELTATVSRYDRPDHVALDLRIGGLDAVVNVELIALSPKRTRMSLEIELMPRSITSRVLVQSLRLKRASLTKTLRKRLGEFAEHLEARPSRTA